MGKLLRIYPPPLDPTPHLEIQDAGHPTLDRPLILSELRAVLNRLRNRKAAGPDGIPNEFYKFLPPPAIHILHSLLNEIFISGQIPLEWRQSTTILIYKKGAPTDPMNYRPICLANCISKIFTSILCDRITVWAEEARAIPETQAGFRKRRGCQDHLFTLNAAVQIGTENRKKVYALFIDFRRAFPSVSHPLLWQQLHFLGLSGATIRILQSLYTNASTRIWTHKGHTKPILLTEGVAQGCPLSPLLFNLFVSDLPTIFTIPDVGEIHINETTVVHVLQYADDTVPLASSPLDMNRKILRLDSYFRTKKLVVNLGKTNIIIFRRHGRPPKVQFFYCGKEIEIVKNYKYLGVKHSSSLLFRDALIDFQGRALAASSKVWEILTKSRNYSVDS